LDVWFCVELISAKTITRVACSLIGGDLRHALCEVLGEELMSYVF
jgi:hypothetical protein